MIHFSYIKWKNFLSTGNQFTQILLDRSPTTLIVGENGAGKSTILDALCFVLFGKAFRNINKPQLVNSINQKDCLVEIEFKIDSKTYRVIRGIKPAVFQIYCNGELLNQNAAAKDYQQVLEQNILKLNYKSFTQIVILGSASFTPFMQLPLNHRREIIEDILDIQIFSKMNTLLKTKMSETSGEIDKLTYMIDIEKRLVESLGDTIKNIEADRDNKRQKIIDEIVKTNDEITVAQSEVIRLMDLVKVEREKTIDHQKLSAKSLSISNIQNKLSSSKSRLNSEIEFYHDNNDCPTCKQSISEEFCDTMIQQKNTKITEIDDALLKLESEVNEINKSLENIREINKIIDEYNQNIAELNNSIIAGQRYLDKLQKSKSDYDSSDVSNIEAEKAKQREHAAKVVSLSEDRQKLRHEQQYQSLCATLLKDTGIKTKVVKQYLPVINKLVNKYLTMMDFFVHFELDEAFNESIKSRHRDDFSYASFSEGEKQRIDLALLFTWRIVAKMKNSASTNLLILDEVFDSSLDIQGTDYVMTLLESIGEDSNVFVISHKGDQLFDKFRSVLRFEKKQNYSVIA